MIFLDQKEPRELCLALLGCVVFMEGIGGGTAWDFFFCPLFVLHHYPLDILGIFYTMPFFLLHRDL